MLNVIVNFLILFLKLADKLVDRCAWFSLIWLPCLFHKSSCIDAFALLSRIRTSVTVLVPPCWSMSLWRINPHYCSTHCNVIFQNNIVTWEVCQWYYVSFRVLEVIFKIVWRCDDYSVIDYNVGFIGRWYVVRDLYWRPEYFFLFKDFSFAFRVAKCRLCICCPCLRCHRTIIDRVPFGEGAKRGVHRQSLSQNVHVKCS